MKNTPRYLAAFGILIGVNIGFSQETAQLAPYTETLPNSLAKIDMVPIKGEKVKPFYIATTETPWEVYDVFLKSGPASPAYDQTAFAPDAIARPSKSYILPDLGWGHKGYPVINVSITSVEMFCRWLSSVTKKKYRLPTEAEWALACADKNATEASAWHMGNSRKMTHPVAKKEANKYGLYDILGNAGEWTTDAEGKPVLCGGTFLDELAACTSSVRRRWEPKWQETDPQLPKSRWWLSDAPFAGFRLVCEP